MADKDTLDRVIGFLQKREGIDKTLKLIRYTSRLVAAVSPQDSEAYKRFSAFEKSVGVSRKAFRLGKFLQDYNSLRKSKTTGWIAILELVAYGGEGVYFFIEQLAWLIKAGALDKSNEAQLSTISCWCELAGYMANIWLSLIKLREVRQQLASTEAALNKLLQDEAAAADSGADAAASDSKAASKSKAPALRLKLSALHAAHQLRVLAIVQDLADSALALNDIRGGRDKVLGHPVTLALAGLVSGAISARKNWNS